MSTTPERPDHSDDPGQDDERRAEHTEPVPPPPASFGTEPSEEAPAAPPPPQSDPTPPPPAPPGTGGYPGPPAGGYGQAPTAYGAPAGTMAPLTPQEEKGWSLAAHLLVLVGGFIAPLIIWLVFKGRGPFLEHHAKESLNFQITVMIAMFVAVILTFLLVGIVLVLALLPWMLVMPILAAVKANNGEWYRYPLTLRLIK